MNGKSGKGKPVRKAKDWRAAVKLLTDTLADLDPRNKAADDQLLELLFISRALDALEFPVRRAEQWVRRADFPAFLDEIEKLIRGIWSLVNTHFGEHPLPFSGNEQERAQHVISDLDLVRKNLDLVAKLRADRTRIPADFSAEREELRRLRVGKLKINPPAKGPQP